MRGCLRTCGGGGWRCIWDGGSAICSWGGETRIVCFVAAVERSTAGADCGMAVAGLMMAD
jgi:hypothetical protein